jgi:hypothetical protein
MLIEEAHRLMLQMVQQQQRRRAAQLITNGLRVVPPDRAYHGHTDRYSEDTEHENMQEREVARRQDLVHKQLGEKGYAKPKGGRPNTQKDAGGNTWPILAN